MNSGAFMKRISDRQADLNRQRKSRAKQKCPQTDGDILVAVYRLDTFKPIVGMGVTIAGASAGAAQTDEMGVAEYLARPPGGYTYAVDYAASTYRLDHQEHAQGMFSLAGGAVAVKTSGVQPGGALKVEVRELNDDDTPGALVGAADILGLQVSGVDAGAAPSHTFEGLRPGDYTAGAVLREHAFMADRGKSEPVTVVEGEVAEITILVVPRTWLKIKVRDLTAKADIPKCTVEVDLPDKSRATLFAGGEAGAPFVMRRTAGACTLVSTSTPGDDVYELVGVV